jgi:hypothetical protein
MFGAGATCSVLLQKPEWPNMNLSVRQDDLFLGQLCPMVWGSQMGAQLQRLAGITDTTNDLPWVISYLAGLTGLIWLAHMAGTHVHLLHAAA